jgi:biotin carboxylase
MKKILFIGGGYFQLDGIKKANDLKLYTIVIDGNNNAVGKDYANEFYHLDITNKEEVYSLAKKLDINAVVSIASEVSMETLGFVVSKLDLPGYGYDIIYKSHDKILYYEIFKNSGIKVPKTWIFKVGENIMIDHPGPLYVKPSKGSGSRGVKKINDITSLNFQNYCQQYLQRNEKIIIQEEIKGTEMTVDGFIQDGKFYLLAVSEEINDHEKGHTFSSELIFPPKWISQNDIKQLVYVCNSIAKALSITEDGPMHLEFIKAGDTFYVIDFSLRGGGFDVFTKIIQKTSGVDILSLYINSALGKKVSIPTVELFNPLTLSFVYPDRKGEIVSINTSGLDKVHDKYFLKILYNLNDKVEEAESGKQRLAYYICYGVSHQENENLKTKIRKKINFVINE